ncbi:hypothetical protein PR003_g8191 [Phytophthora rubi]|uniref:Uncharacterized protein n=1 Tax=Phytophthora rubi TaxID=129364 RepID=A0A6A4FK68_9STRA|nr:hypothetical protein PR003_g8191 [Phytophthora rubi]
MMLPPPKLKPIFLRLENRYLLHECDVSRLSGQSLVDTSDYRRIHEVQVDIAKKLKKGTYEVPGEEKPFKPKEQGDADSDFLDDEDISDDEDAEELEEKLPADEAPDEDDEDQEDPPGQGGEGEPSDEPPAKSKGSDSSASATKSK